jgi:hypothetical protein
MIVVRPPTGDVTLTCGGSAMVELDAPRTGQGHGDTAGDGALLGKRYVDEEAGIELLCTKPGAGAVACDGRPLEVKVAKPLPSSD